MPKTKIYNRYGFDEFSEKMIQKIKFILHTLLPYTNLHLFQLHIPHLPFFH